MGFVQVTSLQQWIKLILILLDNLNLHLAIDAWFKTELSATQDMVTMNQFWVDPPSLFEGTFGQCALFSKNGFKFASHKKKKKPTTANTTEKSWLAFMLLNWAKKRQLDQKCCEKECWSASRVKVLPNTGIQDRRVGITACSTNRTSCGSKILVRGAPVELWGPWSQYLLKKRFYP